LLVIIAIVLWLVLVFFHTFPAWPMTLYRLICDGVLSLVWLASAAGAGAMVLRRFEVIADASPDREAEDEQETPSDNRDTSVTLVLVTSAALGLGMYSLIVLGLGLAGWLNMVTSIIVLLLGLIAGGCVLFSSGFKFGTQMIWPAQPAGWGWLLLLAVPFVAIMTAGAMLPPYLLWSPDEPHGYDVVEYHLQVPREWYEAGRVIPLDHNVFSYFPFNVEMHYLLAMHLRGGPWAGMYLAAFMHGWMIVLAAAAAGAFAFGQAAPPMKRWAAAAAVVAMLTTPWLAQLGAICYDEGGLLLFGTLSIGWAAMAIRHPQHRLRRFALAGAMAGLACGCKLTAVPEILLAIAATAVLFGCVGPASAHPTKSRLLGPAVFLVSGLLVFFPWLIRTWMWSGNPVFPELPALLGKGHFSDVQIERWQRAHSPQAAQQSIPARLKSLAVEAVGSWQYGFALLPLALLGIVWKRKEPDVAFLGTLLFLLALFWVGFTHLQSRFFILAVPIAALLVARLPWFIGLAIVAPVGFSLFMLHQQIDRFPPDVRSAIVGTETLSDWMTPAVAQAVPSDAQLALIGDARAFLYQRPMSLLRYHTIFDADTSDGQDIIDAFAGPKPNGVRQWLLIDPTELARFEKTYQPFPPLPPQVAVHREPYLLAR
jgi:hypothetical protein